MVRDPLDPGRARPNDRRRRRRRENVQNVQLAHLVCGKVKREREGEGKGRAATTWPSIKRQECEKRPTPSFSLSRHGHSTRLAAIHTQHVYGEKRVAGQFTPQ